MSRPVHYVNTEERDYTVVSKDPWVFEFRVNPKEIGELRQPRALIAGTNSARHFNITKVRRVPGPPVEGMHLVQVTAKMET